MTGLLFADTNVLIYSLDPRDRQKRARAKAIVETGVASGRLITSPQGLNECYAVLTGRKQIMPVVEARLFVTSLFPTCRSELTLDTVSRAWTVEAETGFSWWDCLLLSSALIHGCTHFLSEDLSDHRDVQGMTLLNPFTNDVLSLLS